jgi:hypothetical protein
MAYVLTVCSGMGKIYLARSSLLLKIVAKTIPIPFFMQWATTWCGQIHVRQEGGQQWKWNQSRG